MTTIEKLIEQAEASDSQAVTFEGKTYTPMSCLVPLAGRMDPPATTQ